MAEPRSATRSQVGPHAREPIWAGRWFLEIFFLPCWWQLLPSLQLILQESSQTSAAHDHFQVFRAEEAQDPHGFRGFRLVGVGRFWGGGRAGDI